VLDRLVAVTNAIYMSNDRDCLTTAVGSGCDNLGFDSFLMFCHKASKPEMILDSTLTNFSNSFLLDHERLAWSDDDFMLDTVLQTDEALVWGHLQASLRRYA